MNDYAQRLRIPIDGNPSFCLYTSAGLKVATGYLRVVIGGRGPYVEFSGDQVDRSAIHVPNDQAYRLTSNSVYYDEWRSNDEANVKFYHQKVLVGYADYLLGMWYASPFCLFDSGGTAIMRPIMETIAKVREKSIFD